MYMYVYISSTTVMYTLHIPRATPPTSGDYDINIEWMIATTHPHNTHITHTYMYTLYCIDTYDVYKLDYCYDVICILP